MAILECFASTENALGVREISRMTNMHTSVVQRTINTFTEAGYLIQDESTKKYKMGYKMFIFYDVLSHSSDPHSAIYELMQNLASEINESVFLTYMDNEYGVTTKIAESSKNIKYAVSLGTKTPLYIGASCKVMFAYLEEEQQLELLAYFHEKQSEEEHKQLLAHLKNELQTIRQHNWCMTVGEYNEHAFGISVPLFNNKKEIMASLTISGLIYDMDEQREKYMLEQLLQVSHQIQSHITKL
ncbi:IclR family transcriptional regulator [Lysinibacillus parviboronicapiens]|uniref:IclR family transcriptional regulator n=1 Tax=Lysinibacillus parviboronicapiens TaxID=436516 RepID=UPI001EE70AAB|nr:IclR family transcriptional regulator C-terminal domain-containing protein [Lysinibacillus parviboronicapiens]